MKLKFTYDWIQFSVYQTIKHGTIQINDTDNCAVSIGSDSATAVESEFRIQSNDKFSVVDTEKKIANFRKLYEVFDRSDLETCLFTIEANPRVSFIDPSLCVIKLANRKCYDTGIYDFIVSILEAFSFNFVNYTRLDICTDNNDLGGIDPQLICARIASNEYMLKANKKEKIHQKNEKAIVSDWGQNLQVHKVKTKYSGVSFGSRSSEVQVNYYDKTKEMLQKTQKPWVYSWWDNHENIDQERPVFRLEFSLKSNSKRIFKFDQKTSKTYKDADLVNYIDKLASWCLDKHFYVVKFDARHEKHVERMEKVFNFETVYFPIFLDKREKSNTMVKSYLKKRWESIMKRKTQLGIISREIYSEFLGELNKFNLYRWFHERVASINLYFNELYDKFTEDVKGVNSAIEALKISVDNSLWGPVECDVNGCPPPIYLTGENALIKVNPERFFKYLDYATKRNYNS